MVIDVRAINFDSVLYTSSGLSILYVSFKSNSQDLVGGEVIQLTNFGFLYSEKVYLVIATRYVYI